METSFLLPEMTTKYVLTADDVKLENPTERTAEVHQAIHHYTPSQMTFASLDLVGTPLLQLMNYKKI